MMTKKIPMRKCVGCMEMKEKKDLVRIVKSPEDEIFLDTTGRANGRGAYICNNAGCLKKAIKNKGLERSFKSQIPADVLQNIEKELS
ncbi:RNase P modulator RnpM [Butyrivibrio proteoclasticus]|uniref:RNase P modulator RnpM n=1 Tax=Butyrivibrio proteoclasticus TaxID=43305 RepID=UPI00047A364A